MGKTIVAIPVRDEAERIAPCLEAFNAQTRCPDLVVVLLNNCTDGTESAIQAMAPRLRFPLDMVSLDLPPEQASAGHARCMALQLAAKHADSDSVLMTTDADAVVSSDWISRNLEALRNGADIVCGRAIIEPVEAAAIPAHLHEDDARECRLIALLDNFAWLLDPEPHDPLPRHTEASGASLAVRIDAFHQVGGIPPIRSGEDRAFVQALWMMDARVRHDPLIEVTVSGRIVGRAEGGMADAMRRRMVRQDEFTDDQCEPAEDALRRYALRYRARRAWAGFGDPTLARDLQLSTAQLGSCLSRGFFGSAWAGLELRSAILRRRRVRFVELARQIVAAESLLHEAALPGNLAAD